MDSDWLDSRRSTSLACSFCCSSSWENKRYSLALAFRCFPSRRSCRHLHNVPPKLGPVLLRKGHVGQHIVFGLIHQIGQLRHLRPDPVSDTTSSRAGSFRRFLSKRCGDEGGDDAPPALSSMRQGIAHEANPATLPSRIQHLDVDRYCSWRVRSSQKHPLNDCSSVASASDHRSCCKYYLPPSATPQSSHS